MCVECNHYQEGRWIRPFGMVDDGLLTCPDKSRMWDLNSDVPRSGNQILVMVNTSDNETFSIDPRWNIRRIKSQRHFVRRQELVIPNKSVSKRKARYAEKAYSRIWIKQIPIIVIIIHRNWSRCVLYRPELLGYIFNQEFETRGSIRSCQVEVMFIRGNL